jgi:osmoprotectant transport system ATP-binding protein
MAETNAIVAEAVSKRFTEATRSSVDECSFAVEQGQLVVLLGPSGCGKTTLLKMINRLYEPTSGRILVDGVDVMQLPATQLRRRIGYVIQQTGLFPHMRIEQNIEVVPRLLGWPRKRIDARIDELLELIGLPREYRRRYPRQLSGGEQQRVGIARALAADPQLLLMDEPFGAIDAITRTRLQDELLQIQRKLHKTILFVTHDVDEALRLADKIIVMREGRIVQFDTPLTILTRPCDDFVARLVNANDVLRTLGLLLVGSATDRQAMPLEGVPRVDAGGDLRDALGLLLSSGADSLAVIENGRPIGVLSFDSVQHVIRACNISSTTLKTSRSISSSTSR